MATCHVDLPWGVIIFRLIATTAVLIGLTLDVAANELDFEDFSELNLESLLDAEVQSASGRNEQISQAPAVIEVIDRKQIRAWGASNLYEVLSRLAGIETVENHWGRVAVSIRGALPELFNDKVLFLIDGHPLYEAGNMSFFLEQIPINAVERVEVIRGPGGVLFGTNAYAGVIHVFTDNPEQNQARVEFGAGGLAADGGTFERVFGTEVRASGSNVWETGYLTANVQFVQTPQWTAIAPRTLFSDRGAPRYTADSFARGETDIATTLKVSQRIGDHTLRFLGGYFQQTKHKWSLLPRAEMESLPTDIQSWFATAHWDFTTANNVRLAGRFGFDNNSQFARGGTIPVYSTLGLVETTIADADTSKLSIGFNTSVDLADDQFTLQNGVDATIFLYETYELEFRPSRNLVPGLPNLDYGKRTYDLNLYFQGTWRPVERLSILAGVRGNLFMSGRVDPAFPKPESRFTPNPRASIVYRVNEDYTLKLLYGRAFRVPSVFNMFARATGVINGDVNLKPETIDTVEAAVDAKPVKGLSLRLNGFVNISKNDIEFEVQGPAVGSQYINGPGIIARGVELSGRYIYGEYLDLYSTIGFQEASKRNTGAYVDDIARVLASVNPTVYFVDRKLQLTPTYRYIGHRADFGGVSIWDFVGNYDFNRWIGVGVTVKNIFDKRYADVEIVRQDNDGGVFQNQPRTVMGWLYGSF